MIQLIMGPRQGVKSTAATDLTRWGSFILAVILLVAAATVPAAEYHVAPDGNDANPGTQAQPFATLQRGHDAAAPGDTVFVHGGTYRVAGERVAGVVLNKSGEPGNPIRFFAFADERPVIDCTGLTSPERPVGVKVSGSWVHLKGLEVCHVMALRGTSYGLWVKDASHTVLERLSLHDNQGPGLFIDGGTGGHLVLNCDSYNNYDPHADTGPGQNADGFGCHYQKRGPSTVFRGCRAWWNSDDGYDWFKQEVPVIIEHCWAMGSGYTPDGAGLAASGNGAGFKMGNTFTGVRHVIRNCVSIRNKAQGFYANHSHGGSDWLGNVAYANRGAAFDMLSDVVLSGTGVHRLCDNIAFPAKIRNDGAADMQHNSWNLGITFTAADLESLSDERFLAPRMPDGGLPDLDLPTLPRAGDALIDRFGSLAATVGSANRDKVELVSGPDRVAMLNDASPGRRWRAWLGGVSFTITIQADTGLEVEQVVEPIERIPPCCSTNVATCSSSATARLMPVCSTTGS
ncbi:MAG: DUF1565 domain-containing protein, partial [Planctomycetia bacterium]|nr:DUF1565 domain-containing protein [Planctomycetia bacterium]